MSDQFADLNKQLAFDYVCHVIFSRAESFIIEGNPAYDSEKALAYVVELMSEWGYSNTRAIGQLEAIRQENDYMREMYGDDDHE